MRMDLTPGRLVNYFVKMWVIMRAAPWGSFVHDRRTPTRQRGARRCTCIDHRWRSSILHGFDCVPEVQSRHRRNEGRARVLQRAVPDAPCSQPERPQQISPGQSALGFRGIALGILRPRPPQPGLSGTQNRHRVLCVFICGLAPSRERSPFPSVAPDLPGDRLGHSEAPPWFSESSPWVSRDRPVNLGPTLE